MTSTTLALPTTSNVHEWNDEEKAIVEAAGLVHTDSQTGQKTLAERPVVAAFLAHCAQTQLNPLARQIYCIARKSKGQLKWQIQISIDGARLVAERSGEYAGQTTPEFTSDGVTWTQVWLSSDPPKAARVGVLRKSFKEPLYAIALWDAYAVYDDVWENGRKTGEKKPSAMWSKMGPLMLAKCAEMLALRKAFPQDLSGLYSSEEMQQAGGALVERETPVTRELGVGPDGDVVETHPGAVIRNQRAQAARVASAPEAPARDWAAELEQVTDLDGLRFLYREAQRVGAFAEPVTFQGVGQTVEQALWKAKEALEETTPPLVEAKPTKVKPRDWLREGRALDAEQLRALIIEASTAGAADEVVGQLEEMYRSLSAVAPVEGASWAEDAGDDRWQGSPAVLDAEVVADDDEVI
ncbi:phage recombination protein Bet [Microcella frigidaquae]|uniref:Phage recombination protein Bet n=1 Tax=Microcella frigidaquae TaxID=424758 RepID=A0A840XK52_9MICO|nr:phage recombination protein Bet [Microcella frigidaquae]MBB5617237.1 phage recombination protein Bet [Microcella frigidaquae]NHN45063.1 phage recombination protein Bet [Microcella frigidaquae]